MNEPPSNANNPSKYNGNHNFDKLCSGLIKEVFFFISIFNHNIH